MKYRELGTTGLVVSEIGFGAEWMGGGKTPEDVRGVMDCLRAGGVNILDCWMADPEIRSNVGFALRGVRDEWIVQGHIGATWQDGQYVRTRDLSRVRPAFEDLLARLGTDHVELGMIHYVDSLEEFDRILDGPFMDYVGKLAADGTIGHVGLSTHSPEVALRAVETRSVEVVMFSLNPAFDMMPASASLDALRGDYEEDLGGIDDARASLYASCEREGVGITVMKGYAGGRLLDEARSPFGVALTPVQCIHYALTRPAVGSIMVGVSSVSEAEDALAYESASLAEKDYASVLAAAPLHAYVGQCTYCGHCAPCAVGLDIALVNKLYDLATMQDVVPESIRAHYGELTVKASACVGCRSCEPRCPFGVSVAERMERAAALFGR